MCCITERPTLQTGTPMRSHLARHHRKSASMDSFFLSTISSKELGRELNLNLSSCNNLARIFPAPVEQQSEEEQEAREEEESQQSVVNRPQLRRRATAEDVRDDDSSSMSDAVADIVKVAPRRARSRRRIKKSVRFSTVQIREHSLIIGDNPSCTTGLAISLGWDHSPSPLVFGVESYERSRRGSRRTCSGNVAASELQLNRRRRMELLGEVGGYHWRELVREERKLRMRERDVFFGRVAAPTATATASSSGMMGGERE